MQHNKECILTTCVLHPCTPYLSTILYGTELGFGPTRRRLIKRSHVESSGYCQGQPIFFFYGVKHGGSLWCVVLWVRAIGN